MPKLLHRPTLLANLDKLTAEEKKACLKALHTFLHRPNANGLNLELLQNSDNFSIRANDKIRLILKKSKDEKGDLVWLWADTLIDHNYDRIDHKERGLYHYTELPLEVLEEAPNEEEQILADLIPEKGIELHHNQFILLSPQQQSAVENARKKQFPLIIHGAPGSGKSSTTLSILRQMVMQVPVPSKDDEKSQERAAKPRFLYLTQSEKLAKEMRKEWEAMLEFEPSLKGRAIVEFATPKKLFEQSAKATTHQLIQDSDRRFATWLKTYTKAMAVTDSDNRKIYNSWNEQVERVYQEFRTLSTGAQGEKYSLFDASQHPFLQVAYKAYLADLENKNEVDLSFHPIEAPDFDLIAVDEAQDLSRLQIQSLTNQMHTKNNQIFFCVGDHQQLSSVECIIPFLHTLYHLSGMRINLDDILVSLTGSYRCAEPITDLANAIIGLKRKAAGHLHKQELKTVKPVDKELPGQVEWLDNPKQLASFEDQGNLNIAIIAEENHFDEACKLFGAHRVYTPKEIKGLEFPHVVLFRPLEHPDFVQANTVFAAESAAAIETDLIHSIPFNKLFVSITRAQQKVSIYQPKPVKHKVQQLQSALKSCVDQLNPQSKTVIIEPTQASAQELERHLQKLQEDEASHRRQILELRKFIAKRSTPQPAPNPPQIQQSPFRTVRGEEKGAGAVTGFFSPKKISEEAALRKEFYELIDQVVTNNNDDDLVKILTHPKAISCLYLPYAKGRETPLFEYLVTYPRGLGVLYEAVARIMTNETLLSSHILKTLLVPQIIMKGSTSLFQSSLINLVETAKIPATQIVETVRAKGLENEFRVLLDTPNQLGKSLLCYFAASPFPNLVSYLHELGAEINQTNTADVHKNTTPLICAISSNRVQSVRYLLDHGANKEAIFMIRSDELDSILKGLYPEQCRDLSSRKSHMKWHTLTPLSFAELLGHNEIVEILNNHTAAAAIGL